MFHRISSFFFGILSYLAFFVTLLYFMGWIVGIGVPTTLDAPATSTTWSSIAIDLGLLTMFGLQHSVMARPAFKEWWTKFVPASLERSVYVLCSSVALFALMAFWQPLGGVVWSAQNETLRMAIYGLFAIGWVILFLATFLINHFDLFGREVKEPFCFNHLKTFVHERCRVDCHLVSHLPVRMFKGLLWFYIPQHFGCMVKERTSRCRQCDLFNWISPFTCKTLKDCRVFGVDRYYSGA